MENKKIIIAIIIVVALIIGLIIGTYTLNSFRTKQTRLLTEESNKILQSDIINDNIDFKIKTEKNYATVEKAIKEYISSLKNIYVEMEEMNEGINPNTIFSVQNMQDKDLTEIENIINEYREKSQNCISELEKMLTDEQISENINTKEFSKKKDYYIELYNTVMFSDVMKKQYNVLEEKIKDEKSKLSEKVKQIEKISKFLKENSDSWTIKDEKIQFTNLNRMTEYYNLLNKLTD